MIPYGRQEITEEDIESVVDALKSNFITQGSFIPKFENYVSEYVGSSYAAALNLSLIHI